MNNIAIIASGSGTNTENIIKFFTNSKTVGIKLIISNKEDAFVLKRAKKFNIESIFLSKAEIYNSNSLLNILNDKEIDFVVLAGFLLLVPSNVISAFRNRIINIHPALLPKYGGKGMYGMNVHKSIIENKESESGITIHYVNEKYDDGAIIFQAKCKVDNDDTPESLATKIHELEYKHFPQVIDDIMNGGF